MMEDWNIGYKKLKSIARYFTTKNTKITKERQINLALPLLVLRALRGDKFIA